MKLVIFIPCLNEETTLPPTLKTIPKKISGIDEIEVLIVDDGSTDKTVEVAKQLGVREFVYHTKRQGLSSGVKDGLNRALELGADIIVLTDGDNQYRQEKIPELIKPIQEGWADTVIADRGIDSIDHFTSSKKKLQHIGTSVLNAAAGTNIPDATSGFRAYSRSAAMQMSIVANYSFATETTIQASRKKQAIAVVPISTNPKLRNSRQFKSSWQHVRRSSITIMRAFIMHSPYAVFLTMATILLILGFVPFGNFVYQFLTHRTSQVFGPHHLQSLIIGTVLLTGSFISFTLGVIADLIRINRLLMEDVLEQVKHIRYD
jgi:glycosyltransferase involved in cell wall biosynthesis